MEEIEEYMAMAQEDGTSSADAAALYKEMLIELEALVPLLRVLQSLPCPMPNFPQE